MSNKPDLRLIGSADAADVYVPESLSDAYAYAFGTAQGHLEAIALVELPTELDTLAFLLKMARDLKAMASGIERRIEGATAKTMGSPVETVDGVGTLERKRGATRKAWAHTELVSNLAGLAKDPKYRCDPMTGEVVYSEAEALKKLILDCAAFSYWRSKELRGLGIAADAYCEEIPGRATVIIRGGA